MPVLLLERIPLPSLKTYATFSIFMLTCALFYSYQIVNKSTYPDIPQNEETHSKNMGLLEHEFSDRIPDPLKDYTVAKREDVYDVLHVSKPESDVSSVKDAPSEENEVHEPDDPFDDINEKRTGQSHSWNGTLPYDNYFFNIMYVITAEVWGVWTLVNTAYCCLIFLGKLIQMFVFGELRVIEQQHLRDRFWNFVFYKFIFIFGVMNVQTMEEVVLWVAWFSTLGFYNLLTQLCKDRFQYVSSSPTTARWVHTKILSLLVFILTSVTTLIVVSVMVGYHSGYSILTFMAAEYILHTILTSHGLLHLTYMAALPQQCVLLCLKALYVVIRYVIHLWDMSLEGIWENRSVYVYYAELLFELTSLCIDFTHHLHMLLWGNIFLSMASLVICMHLRYLMYEFQRRFRRHKNYLTVLRNVQSRFSMATTSELEQNSDNCAICWEKMETARKLPCSHLFHNSCLRSWLEQDTSCPTCRVSLGQSGGAGGDAGVDNTRPPPPDAPPTPTRHHVPFTNHFFHFDASRYVSWLPSFSVEVTHTRLLPSGAVQNRVQSSLLDNMAHQVNSIFPQTPMNAVIEDIQVTQNVDVTIENILEGRVGSTTQTAEDFTPFGSTTGENEDATERDDTITLPTTVSSTGARALQAQLLTNQVREVTDDTQTIVESEMTSSNSSATTSETSYNEDAPSTSGSRFSKCSAEREDMLRQRKTNMLEAARRRYLASSIQKPQQDNTSS